MTQEKRTPVRVYRKDLTVEQLAIAMELALLRARDDSAYIKHSAVFGACAKHFRELITEPLVEKVKED